MFTLLTLRFPNAIALQLHAGVAPSIQSRWFLAANGDYVHFFLTFLVIEFFE